MRPPEKANARLQPGARAIRLTYKPKLRRRKRHVNAPDGWPGGTPIQSYDGRRRAE